MNKLLVLLLTVPALAFGATATLTYDDPKCPAFQISGTSGNFKLTCATTPPDPGPGPGPGPGPAPWPVTCPGFTKTVNVAMDWPATGTTTLHTQNYGNFNAGDVLVIRITPPAGFMSVNNTAGALSLAEYGSPAANRYAVLTTNACDFTGELGHTDGFAIPIRYGGVSISISPIQINLKQYASTVNLVAGTTYYLLVKNTGADGVTPTCTGSCNMVIQFTKPPLQSATARNKQTVRKKVRDKIDAVRKN